MKSSTLHNASFAVGTIFLVSSVMLAICFRYPHFYTAFAFGSWLVLDWFDWRLNGSSILGYFWNHKHRDAFAVFLLEASIFCIVIDYLYGVRLAGMWEWTAYKPVHYLRMYLFMNASYILGMYSLFRVVRSLLSREIPAKNVIATKLKASTRRHLFKFAIGIGALFLLTPLYVLFFGASNIQYAMILPFIGMLIGIDGATGLLGGKPVLEGIVRLNRLQLASAFVTVFLAAVATEGINSFANEWRYNGMPFPGLQFYGVPAAVFFGWIPLVLGAIALVNFVQRFDYLKDLRAANAPKARVIQYAHAKPRRRQAKRRVEG